MNPAAALEQRWLRFMGGPRTALVPDARSTRALVTALAAGEDLSGPLHYWGYQHGRLGWDVNDLFDWLDGLTLSKGRRRLDGLTLARHAMSGWAEGHQLWRAHADAVNATTGVASRAVLVHHLHRLVDLAEHFGVPARALGCLVMVELTEQVPIEALADLARVARLMTDALPPTAVVAATAPERLAALVMVDEGLRPSLGTLLVGLGADSSRPMVRFVTPVPDRSELDVLVEQLS